VPIYEFRCADCRRRSSVFTRRIGGEVAAVCSHCGSGAMSRLISRVAVLRSDDDGFSGIDESSLAGVDENDPRSMAKWVRKMSREMGEPLDAEAESELERLESGEMPADFADDGEDDEFADLD
jgi:putative FmdB family regulatory protein